MPGGDRTGPAGLGPMTGRQAGFCAGYPVPGFMSPAWGRGGGARGWGRGGGGGGWRHHYGYFATGMPGWQRTWGAYPPPAGFAPFTREQELEVLRNQAKSFEQALDDLRRRIREVESRAEGTATT
jgi:hypothetical protein